MDTTQKTTFKAYNIWTMELEERNLSVEDKNLAEHPENQRIVTPKEYEFLQHEYVLAVVLKDDAKKEKVTIHDVEGCGLLRRDFFEDISGREMFSNEPVIMEEGSLSVLKTMKQYEEQKSWKSPLMILSDDKPSEKQWQEFLEFQKSMVGNSATALASLVFGGEFSKEELEGHGIE